MYGKGRVASVPLLLKALDSLKGAEILLAGGLFDSAASRAYFAAYQAARAALICEGHEDPNSHKGVQAAFSRRLVVERKVYPGKKAILNKLRGEREAADYREINISRKRAERQVRDAKALVNAIQHRIGHDR